MSWFIIIFSIFLVLGCSNKNSSTPSRNKNEANLEQKTDYKRYYSKDMVVKEKVYAESWHEIQENDLTVFCGNYVIEFVGKIAMYPDLMNKNRHFEVGIPHYVNPERDHYSRSAFHWRVVENTLYLKSVSYSNAKELEFKITSHSNNEIYINSSEKGETEACILQRH
jgi:hypothetical protein